MIFGVAYVKIPLRVVAFIPLPRSSGLVAGARASTDEPGAGLWVCADAGLCRDQSLTACNAASQPTPAGQLLLTGDGGCKPAASFCCTTLFL